MKRLLFLFTLLGSISLNYNLLSVKKENAQVDKISKKQLTKKDMAKIAVASLGFILFTTASVTSYHSGCKTKTNQPGMTDCLSCATAMLPLIILDKSLMMMGIDDPNDYRTNVAFIMGGVISGALAYKLGSYVYKKIAHLKPNKHSTTKTIAN